MGTLKLKSSGGSGGKRGHSNMDHWFFNDETKTAARTQRRIEGKKASREGISEYLAGKPKGKKRGK